MTATVDAERTNEEIQGWAPTFPALDTMRAVGSIAVVATHTSFWAGAYTSHGVWGTALSRLDVGVAIFFVLSGFLLSRPYLARASQGMPRPGTGRYLWKRALRILPVYVVAATSALLLLPENDGADLGLWQRTLTLTDLYSSNRLPAGLTQMWSLSTEVAFYLALPALMLIAVGGSRAGRLAPARVLALLAVLVAITIAWILTLSEHVSGSDRLVLQWLPTYLSWFSVGIALALGQVLLASGQSGRLSGTAWLRDLGRAPGACWGAALALFVVASTPVAGPSLLVPPTLGEAVTKNLLYAVIAGLIILPGIFAAPSGRYIRTASWPVFRHLGHISYSVFCIHLVVLECVMRWTGYEVFAGHGWQIFVLTLAASLVISEVLYRFVELPFMRLKNLGRGPASPE